MYQALGQAERLDGEDVLAALGSPCGVAGHEGMRVDMARETGLVDAQREARHGIARALGCRRAAKGGHATTLGTDELEVYLGNGRTATEGPALCEQAAVLGHHVVTGEDEVLRRFTPTGARIDVCADETGTLPRDERAPVVGLADDGIGSGEVADDRRPRLGMSDRRRAGNPEILADLRRHDEGGHVIAREELMGAKRYVKLTGHVDHGRIGRTRRKVPALVELVVGGDVALGDHAENGTGRDGDGTIVELGVCANGGPQDDECVILGRAGGDLGDARLGGVEKGILPEEVLAGVARDAELRQDDDLGTVLDAGLVDPTDDRLDVEGDVGHADLGRHCCDRNESVLHGSLLAYAL